MTSTPPPDPFPGSTPRRSGVHRSTTNSMLGGVCGGLAEATGIDAVFWRIGAVLLAITGPGVVVYLLLWVALPLGPTPADFRPSVFEEWAGRLHTMLTSGRSTS